MLRMLALAVLLMAISTTAAHGTDSAALATSSPATDREVSPAPGQDARSMDLRLPSALAWTQPTLRGAVSSDGKRRQRAAVASARQAVPPARGGILGGFGRPARESARAALAYPISDRFSLDLGYWFLDVEDVIVRRGEPGTVDPTYSSHHLVFHARWRF